MQEANISIYIYVDTRSLTLVWGAFLYLSDLTSLWKPQLLVSRIVNEAAVAKYIEATLFECIFVGLAPTCEPQHPIEAPIELEPQINGPFSWPTVDVRV